MKSIGIAVNLIALLTCLVAANHLWRLGWDYITMAGGLPEFSVEYVWALITTPGLHLRLAYWLIAWSSLCFSGGFTILAIAGGHWGWHQVASALENRNPS